MGLASVPSTRTLEHPVERAALVDEEIATLGFDLRESRVRVGHDKQSRVGIRHGSSVQVTSLWRLPLYPNRRHGGWKNFAFICGLLMCEVMFRKVYTAYIDVVW